MRMFSRIPPRSPAARRPTRRARLLLVPLVALVLVGLPACGGDEQRLTVYSGRGEELVGPLLEQYSEETGIGIDVRYGDTADLALLIDEEGDSSPADVFISQSPGAVSFLDDAGRLTPLDQDVLDLVDQRYRAADGHWVGLSGRQRVMVYDESRLDEADLPSSVFDLTDPAWAGRVALAPSNASFIDFVTAMRAQVGDDATLAWLQGMADNDSPTYANNTAIVEAVGRGEVEAGLVNHYYNARALADTPDLPSRNHYFAPDDVGALVLETAAGVLDTSDQPDDAADLVRFLLGEEAQTFFAEETYEYPLAAGVDPLPQLPPLEGLGADEVDLSRAEGGLGRTLELIEQAGLTS